MFYSPSFVEEREVSVSALVPSMRRGDIRVAGFPVHLADVDVIVLPMFLHLLLKAEIVHPTCPLSPMYYVHMY